MAAELTILRGAESGAGAERVARIAEFLGAPHAVRKPAEVAGAPDLLVAAHWTAIKEGSDLLGGVDKFLVQTRAAFIYGWNESDQSNDFLGQLTKGALRTAVIPSRSRRPITVSSDLPEAARLWAGLDFEVSAGAEAAGFVSQGTEAPPTVWLKRCEVAFVLDLISGGTRLVLCAENDVADLEAPAPKDASLLAQFERLAPLMLFIRRWLGKWCWRPDVARACFIIDDPLLQRRYGRLNYDELLDSVRRKNYSACVAFIPWNYRRTDPRVAELFRKNADRLSICVHGCDHTRQEFCGEDEARLRDLTKLALWRMEQHQRLTSLPFAPVMVFPQGLFSRRAMEALAKSRFLAAVNTTPFPADGGESKLTLRDLMEPAITRFSGFPLFTRRYPKSLAECAMDLFLGKPLLLVEHHAYFGDRCDAAGDFVGKLNRLAPELRWTDLNAVCSQTSLSRKDAAGHTHIRFYTDRFALTAGPSALDSVLLSRRIWPDDGPVSANINGRRAESRLSDQYLTVPVTLQPYAQAEVILEHSRAELPQGGPRRGLLDHTKVLLRRRASEFRDNVVERSPWASKMAERSLQWLRESRRSSSPSQPRNGALSK